MPADAYAVGTIWTFDVPAEHAKGSEQHDNPETGSRPWVVVARLGRRRDLVIAVPLTSSRPTHGALGLTLDELDTSVAKDALKDEGTLLVEQVRAISTHRVDTARGCRGRLKSRRIKELLQEVQSLFEPEP